jgi:hypothetical protein
MKISGHTSMGITAFCFMVLLLVITAPSAGSGPEHAMKMVPVSEHALLYGMELVPAPVIPIDGPGSAGTPVFSGKDCNGI